MTVADLIEALGKLDLYATVTVVDPHLHMPCHPNLDASIPGAVMIESTGDRHRGGPGVTADPYVRDRAGRFAKLPPTLFRDCPPIPEPQPVPEDTQDRYYRVPAPRCIHGHFARWAARNCCKETRRA